MNRFFPYHQIRKIKAVYWYLDISYIFSLFLHYDEQVRLMIETIIDSNTSRPEVPKSLCLLILQTILQCKTPQISAENDKKCKTEMKRFLLCCVGIRTISHVGEEAGTLNGNCITFRLSSPPPPPSSSVQHLWCEDSHFISYLSTVSTTDVAPALFKL